MKTLAIKYQSNTASKLSKLKDRKKGKIENNWDKYQSTIISKQNKKIR